MQNIFRTGWPVLFTHVVRESTLNQISKPETLAMVLTANDRGPHSCRVHGQWKRGCLLADVWFISTVLV